MELRITHNVFENPAPPKVTVTDTTTICCPRCKDRYPERIKRSKIVRMLLFWLNLKRYHCYRCNKKFYKMS